MHGVAPITAERFYPLYKRHLRQLGSWAAYQTASTWTPIAREAAILTCRDLGLQCSTEYYRLDVAGYSYRSDHHCDWDLRVAFETENTAHWLDELCKLSHMAADLRVLFTHQLHRHPHNGEHPHRGEHLLEEYIHRMADRITRIPHCQWLFIFGPHHSDVESPFVGYTLTHPERCLSAMIDSQPLRGVEWEM